MKTVSGTRRHHGFESEGPQGKRLREAIAPLHLSNFMAAARVTPRGAPRRAARSARMVVVMASEFLVKCPGQDGGVPGELDLRYAMRRTMLTPVGSGDARCSTPWYTVPLVICTCT